MAQIIKIQTPALRVNDIILGHLGTSFARRDRVAAIHAVPGSKALRIEMICETPILQGKVTVEYSSPEMYHHVER